MDSREQAIAICRALDEHKGENIMLLDVSEATVIADYFVICSGRNPMHVHALSDDLEEKMETAGYEVRRKEGMREGRWGVLDFGEVVVHLFSPQEREFYHLERLWDNGTNQVSWKAEE